MRWLTPERVRLYPAVTFAVIVAAAVANWMAGDGLQNAIAGSLGGDFLSFYTGGALTDAGRALDLLDPEEQRRFQQQLLPHAEGSVSLWVSPPFVAWAFVPLSRLPYVWAYAVFVLVSGATLVLSVGALRREWPALPTPHRLTWIALQYYPTLQWLMNGQTTGFWLLLLTLAVVRLRRGRDFSAGLLLGCFACKPPLVLGVVAALLGARRWRTLCGAAVSGAAWIACGFATLPEAMRAYVHGAGGLVSVVRDPGYHQVGLHGSFELSLLLFDSWWPSGATVLGTLLTLSMLATLGALWLRAPWDPGTGRWDRRIAASLALGLIASPHVYGYDLALLLLPFFIVAAQYPRASGTLQPLDGGGLLAVTAAVWALGLVGPVLAVAQQWASERLFGTPIALQVGVLAITAWAYCVLRSHTGAATFRTDAHRDHRS